METLHYLIMKTNAMLNRKIISEAYKIGLSSGQPKILDYLSHYGESDQKTIASFCEIEQATVGSILNRMENADLIERKQKQGNRRSLFVCLTDKGRKSAEEMQQIFNKADLLAASDLSEEDNEKLKINLSKICMVLEKENQI